MNIEQIYARYSTSGIVTTDSRSISPGCMYFGLKGDKFDGNSFAKQALDAGASYAVIDNKDFFIDHRTILVEDSLTCLQDLARFHRSKLSIPLVGITGTNGKTTTKELINAVLSEKYKVLATKGNLNNHIGVPLTLLSITPQVEIAIIEMGANHPYEIEFLCNIAQPTHGLITNIGKAHLEGFGGFKGVIKTKTELYDHLKSINGVIFYNSDDDLLKSLLPEFSGTLVSYGFNAGDFFRGKLLPGDPFVSVQINLNNNCDDISVPSNLVGDYNAPNIMAAICLGCYFKVPFQAVKTAITKYIPANNRSQLLDTSRNRVILDCYNANPSSTIASLNNFERMQADNKAVILGDMLELGDDAREEHDRIIKYILSMRLNEVFLVGEWFHKLSPEYNIKSFENAEQLKKWLNDHSIVNHLILVKGSRGIQLEKIVDLL